MRAERVLKLKLCDLGRESDKAVLVKEVVESPVCVLDRHAPEIWEVAESPNGVKGGSECFTGSHMSCEEVYREWRVAVLECGVVKLECDGPTEMVWEGAGVVIVYWGFFTENT